VPNIQDGGQKPEVQIPFLVLQFTDTDVLPKQNGVTNQATYT